MRALRAMPLAALACALPRGAEAHAFAQRYDLPLPLGYFIAGAALAVALSFVASFLMARPLSEQGLSVRIPVPDGLAAPLRALLTGIALLLLAGVVISGLYGPVSPTRNFATVFVWVIFWVGFFLFTALVTDLWQAGNPFRPLVAGILRLARLDGSRRQLPSATGWLAVLGLMLISWIETISGWSENPRSLVPIAAAYLLYLLIGSAVAGVGPWFAAADPLTRLFGLLGNVAPLKAERGALRLRVPSSGLLGLDTGIVGAVFTLTLIALVMFDGLSETPFWAAILDWVTRSMTLRPYLLDIRAAGFDILKVVRSVGQLATIAAALAAYGGLTLAVWLASGRSRSVAAVFSGLAASLLPIAVAYHLAHYVSYLVLASQLAIAIASDPMGLGWDLFGGARHVVNLGAISAAQTWWVAAGALVTGHGLSVFVSHAEALGLFPDRAMAVRSQVPIMVFMVGLTGLSLWILAQPIVL